MKTLIFLVSFTGVALCIIAFPFSGQQTKIDVKELETNFYQARKISQDVIKDYSWFAKTDVEKEGKILTIRIEECHYGADGKLQEKMITNQEAKLPSAFLVHQIANEMKTKMVTFMNNLRVFLEKYSLDDRKLGSPFFSRAIIGTPDPAGQVLIAGKDVIVKGDNLRWWIDMRNKVVTKASIVTIFEENQVEFNATYKFLNTGLQYMNFAEIRVPSKSITVRLQFSDYTKVR